MAPTSQGIAVKFPAGTGSFLGANRPPGFEGIGLIVSIPIARLLGKSGFGEYGIINSTMVMFSTFAGAGLGMTALKYVAELRTKDPKRAGRVIVLSGVFPLTASLVAAGVMVGLAPWLATRTLAASHLASLVALSALGLMANTMNQAQNGILIGFEAFRSVATRNLIGGAARIAIMIGSTLGWGLRGAVWGMVATEVVIWVLNHIAIRRECLRAGITLRLAGCWREVRALWHFSLPSTLAGALAGPLVWTCNAMLVNQPHGYAELGLYNASMQWYTAMLLIPWGLGSTMFPVMANLFGNRDMRRYRKVLTTGVLFTAAVTLVGSGLVMVLSPLILKGYGREFAGGKVVFCLVVASSIFSSQEAIFYRAIVSRGQMWMGLGFKVGFALLLLALTHSFLRIGLGAAGLAAAMILTNLTGACGQGAYVGWTLKRESRETKHGDLHD